MSYIYPATLLCDFYKVEHRRQYPEDTELVYGTWIARKSRIEGINKVVNFGLQAFIKEYLIEYFQENFFDRTKEDIVDEYIRVIKNTLGVEEVDTGHLEALHDLQYIPLKIMALPEGTRVPIGVPMFSIENTVPEFFWFTNYIETLMSASIWQGMTSATIAFEYRKLLGEYAKKTVGNTEFVPFQGHDFSMRGMSSLASASISGAGHALSFVGSDTIPALFFLEKYYNANCEKELVITSIPATEHSVMCAYGQDEISAYRHLITEVYPNGFVSIVSDTWDLWKVLDEVILPLKDTIMARDGKVVIRPDTGDPADILCGDPNGKTEMERKGVVEVLWDIFGGETSEQGYKVLDSHIGTIYGDAITLERCEEICYRLEAKGFASINVVYGIGSYTYQFNTRDTFGFALKSSFVVIDGKERQIYKAPKTDTDGFKKSLKGRAVVLEQDCELIVKDGLGLTTEKQEFDNLLEVVYVNGTLILDADLSTIRSRLSSYL